MANTTDCAWCLTENGTLQDQGSNDSHGICQDHSDALLVNWYQNKFDAVPSYFERFQHDVEAEAGSAA